MIAPGPAHGARRTASGTGKRLALEGDHAQTVARLVKLKQPHPQPILLGRQPETLEGQVGVLTHIS